MNLYESFVCFACVCVFGCCATKTHVSQISIPLYFLCEQYAERATNAPTTLTTIAFKYFMDNKEKSGNKM